MYLKSLEMQGFKSFPDKTTLNFGSGITAVVGPNGSGKSNIADAVRWVLGEQSTKSLRGAKMEDVVFSGTSTRRAVGYAEVTLRLDNADGSLKNGKKEVSVTRRYYRSGESEYRLNGETVRLKDIYELFMDTGLGKAGYSMVSQGRINDLVSARSTERRDMLEEAAGISHYRYRRADALKRLEQSEENLVRLRDILAELESRIEPLKQQSEKAERFLEYAGERKNLEIGLWLRTIDKTKEGLSQQETKLAAAEASYSNAEKELSDIEGEIDKIISQTQGITVLIDEVRCSCFETDEKVLSINGQIAVLENSIEHNNEAIERIRRDKLQEDDTNKHLAEQVKQAQEETNDLKARIEEKKKQLLSVTQQVGELTLQSDLAAGSKEKLFADLSRLTVELADCRVTISTAYSSTSEIDSRIADIEENAKNLEASIAGLIKERDEAENSLNLTCERLQELGNSLEGLQMRTKLRENKVRELTSQEQKLLNELERCQSEAAILSDLEKNMEGYQGSIKAVMREVKRGTLSGVHAPVSQLISVKEKYALAIETALGSQIQNIVTENENDAKRAISFLKQSNSGRATFLPLTAIKGKQLEEKSLATCLGYIDLASRLVQCEKKYEQIILSQLGKTAVAEDMDAAVAIAKKYGYRFRVVTLDGQLINAGGSITGGSKAHTAGILSRGNKISRLIKKTEELKAEIADISKALKSATQSYNASESELLGLESELATFGEDKIRHEGLLALKEGQLSTFFASKESYAAEKTAARTRRESFVLEARSAEIKLNEIQGEIQSKENQIAKLTGDSEALHNTRENLSSIIQEINLDIVADEKEIEAKKEIIERLARRGSSHNDRIEELNAEIKEIEDRNNAVREQIEQSKAFALQLKEEKNKSDLKIEQLIREREGLEAKSGKMRMLERSKSTEREALSSEVVRLQERKTAMLKEYDEACAKLFEEYELTRREAQQLEVVIENVGQAQKRLSELKNKIKALGSVNVAAIDEYKEVSHRYLYLGGQIEDIEKSKKELLKMIEELTEKMALRFGEIFKEINKGFSETFRKLFDGGKAQISLSDEKDILECAIEINVQPPGKNIQNIDLLSGGEKGLSAIALLFAILKVAPSPFCVFDEVEAALDDINVNRYAGYLRKMAADTQFILITHRRGTMEESDMLYGVTMQEDGVSKLLELKTSQMAAQLSLE